MSNFENKQDGMIYYKTLAGDLISEEQIEDGVKKMIGNITYSFFTDEEKKKVIEGLVQNFFDMKLYVKKGILRNFSFAELMFAGREKLIVQQLIEEGIDEDMAWEAIHELRRKTLNGTLNQMKE